MKTPMDRWRLLLGALTILILAILTGVACGPEPPVPSVVSPTITPRPLAIESPRAAPAPSPTPTLPTSPVQPPSPLPTPTAQAKTDASEGFAFAVCGDSRDGDATYRRLLTRIQEDGNAFLIHLGDVAESGEPAQYARVRALMAGFHLPFYVVPGNHDLRGSSLAAFLDFSPHHVAHQSFDYGLVHLTLADSSRGGLDNQELTWLRTDLDASHQPVKMVFVHHPPFDPQGGSHVMGSGAQSFVTLMTQMHVRYVFAGHIHAYGRAERDGVTYIVSGGCGSPLSYPPDRGGFFHYVQVRVQGTETSDRVIRLDAAMNP